MSIVVKTHTSIIGDTGYNCHSRNIFKELNLLTPVQIRNWSVGSTWNGYSDEPHNNEYYIDDSLKTMLTEQTLYTQNGPIDFPIYSNYPNSEKPDIHIVLNDNKHPYFYEKYTGPKIAYNVWETTEQPAQFFEALKKFDQVWVPSEWQKIHTVKQGIPANRVKVVPEGVDPEVYKPVNTSTDKAKDRPFRFIVIGRWEYRKSTREIIQAFINTFSEDENVELLLNVDNQFASDGLSTTEDRLEKFIGTTHSGIRILHHLSKEEYITTLQSCDVFVSCSRSEGWNLPLIEAMASGIPSIYSNYGAQLQFAEGKGLPVSIIEEISAGIQNEESWDSTAPGKFAEPDFLDLSLKLRDSYQNYKTHKEKALIDSKLIRDTFTWQNAANIAYRHIQELLNPSMIEPLNDFAWVTCGDLKYMPIIAMLVKSLAKFSSRKIIVYGIDCEVPFSSPNMIAKTLTIPYHSEFDKWYWKQYACIESLTESFENYIWLDGDIVANYNIDDLADNFSELENYPLPDRHIQEDFFAWYKNKDGEIKTQLFNERLSDHYNINRLLIKSHVCMYLYNHECKWWFDEILSVYKETNLSDYSELLQWNDEGIDNLLRGQHSFNKFLPVSNFDVSEWDGTILGKNGKSMQHFISFWRDSGPNNFGNIYGWQFIPKDKYSIKYFHGNKNLEFAKFMLEYIELQQKDAFFDSKYFFVEKDTVKNLGSIDGVSGGTLDIAQKYGWDYAIFHEIYNLKDYEHPREEFPTVKVQPNDVVVDLGGNIGIFTRYAYHMGASKIITFEPDSRYFEILKQNSPENVILFNAAISDSIGKLTLTESDHLGGSNLWHKPDALQTQYEVNTYTLDYLFNSGLIDRIDFLKVDIEGSEILALNGISDDNLRNIRNIAIEYHHEHLKYNEPLRDSFIKRLNKLGFNSHVLFCGYNEALQLIYFWK